MQILALLNVLNTTICLFERRNDYLLPIGVNPMVETVLLPDLLPILQPGPCGPAFFYLSLAVKGSLAINSLPLRKRKINIIYPFILPISMSK